MEKEKLKKSEEVLERRRVARREKYKVIKSDPEKYAIEKAKKREAYLKRKSDKKVKTINDMSPTQQSAQRKVWRENSLRYLAKKKCVPNFEEVTISQLHDTDDKENTDNPVVDPINEKHIARDVNSEIRERKLECKIRVLKRKHANQKKEMNILIKKYQNRCKFLTRKIKKMDLNRIKTDCEGTSSCSDVSKDMKTNQTMFKSAGIKKHKPILDLGKKILKDRFWKNINLHSGSIQELIKDFYEDDIHSRIDAGKKHYVKKFGVMKQKRYLLDSVKNLHKKFLKDNTNIKVSYVTFSRLRPFWVYLPRDDRETCACTAHTNMNLMIFALNQNKIIDIKDFRGLLNTLCCDKYNIKCVGRKCEVCKNNDIPYKEYDHLKEIEYYEWRKDKKKVGFKEINVVKKKMIKIKPIDLIHKLEHSLPKFLTHTVNILSQYYNTTYLKQTLNHDEALIHMDFSENYSYKFAQEVQDLHFGGSRGQVSLHNVVAYVKEDRQIVHHCMSTVSECTRHDAPAIWAHLHKALDFVFEKCPSLTTIHILTDSPTSQYRNKYIFYILTQLRDTFPSLKFVTWNYQECGHGKGAPDGVGAVIKRTADLQVKYGHDVGDFTTFLEVVRKNINNVEIRVVEEYEVLDKQILVPKDISAFKGTMLVHQVIWKYNSDFLEFRSLSCFRCIETVCEHDDKHMQLHKIHKSAFPSTIQNINTIPPSKRITVLNDISINYNNQQNNPSTSGISKDGLTIKRLADVKRDWTNTTFINKEQKVSRNKQEFYNFINK